MPVASIPWVPPETPGWVARLSQARWAGAHLELRALPWRRRPPVGCSLLLGDTRALSPTHTCLTEPLSVSEHGGRLQAARVITPDLAGPQALGCLPSEPAGLHKGPSPLPPPPPPRCGSWKCELRFLWGTRQLWLSSRPGGSDQRGGDMQASW